MKKDKLPKLPPIEKLVGALDKEDSKEENSQAQSQKITQRDVCPILKKFLPYEFTSVCGALTSKDKDAEIVKIGSSIICEYYLYKRDGRCLATVDDSNQYCIYK